MITLIILIIKIIKITQLMPNKNSSKTDYLLRNIPREVWRQAKHTAIDEGITLRELLLKAVAEYCHEKRGKRGGGESIRNAT